MKLGARQYSWLQTFALLLVVAVLVVDLPASGALGQTTGPGKIRIATYNTSLNRENSGQLATELSSGDSQQARKIAEVLRRVRPDVVLLNEFDFDAQGKAIDAFQRLYLGQASELPPLKLPYRFLAPVNTGAPSGLDLNRDGKIEGPQDAFGFGAHEGQYGMVVLSKFPIRKRDVRTFQRFLWSDMPAAKQPLLMGRAYYPAEVWKKLRLSSKSVWDVPIVVDESILHFVVSHPTPPVFDGPEDRNGSRNHDEIRFLADYLSPKKGRYIYDDQGRRGGLVERSLFVVAGDLNADPHDGDSSGNPIGRLLFRAAGVNASTPPRSAGAEAAAKKAGGANATHRGPHATDTASFSATSVGNLRIDYVLPSKSLRLIRSGVYWPPANTKQAHLLDASDHRLVWIDVSPP